MKISNKIKHEIRLVFGLTSSMFLFLVSLAVYRRLILHEPLFDYFRIGYLFVESLVLTKIIMLGRWLQFGERFLDKPLIIPALYRTLVLSCFVVFFSILEHFVFGFFSGKDFSSMYQAFKSREAFIIMGTVPLFASFFFLISCLMDVSRTLGEGKLFQLFFHSSYKK